MHASLKSGMAYLDAHCEFRNRCVSDTVLNSVRAACTRRFFHSSAEINGKEWTLSMWRIGNDRYIIPVSSTRRKVHSGIKAY